MNSPETSSGKAFDGICTVVSLLEDTIRTLHARADLLAIKESETPADLTEAIALLHMCKGLHELVGTQLAKAQASK
jgi:hypothetical protein